MEKQPIFDNEYEIYYIFNLINFDWGDSYESIGNPENYKFVDYYENDKKCTEKEKLDMFAEIIHRSVHNIWIVEDFRGTATTHELCVQLEKDLQQKGKSKILFGEIRLNELGKKHLEQYKDYLQKGDM